MAGELRLTRMLLGMGLRHFSMHPAHLLEIKRRVLSSDAAGSRPLVNRMRRCDDPERVAALLDRLNQGPAASRGFFYPRRVDFRRCAPVDKDDDASYRDRGADLRISLRAH
jgi:hypothetical protein